MKASYHSHRGLIQVSDVTITYQNRTAIEDVSGTFEANSLTAIIGPNGGGKSSFIKALNKLLKLRKGKILHPCRTVCDTAYLPQKNCLDFSFPLNCYEVVGMGLWRQKGAQGAYGRSDYENMEQALKKVGLSGMGNRSIQELSGGQAQRLLFARIILQNASLIILDEPFTAIDTPTCRHLVELILDWHRQGKTIIVALHNLDLVKTYFPQTLLLARKLIGWGPTQDVLTRENLMAAFEVVME